MRVDGTYKKEIDLGMDAKWAILDSDMCIALFTDPEDAKACFANMCKTYPNIAHLFKLEELS